MVRIGNRSISLCKAIVIVLDMAIIFVSLAFALQLRFDFAVPSQYIDLFEKTWPVFVSTAAILFFLFGFYDQIWRFASIRQYMILFFGTMVQPVIAAIYMIRARSNFPRSIYIIYWLVSFVMVVGLRIAYRILANRTSLPALVRHYLVLIIKEDILEPLVSLECSRLMETRSLLLLVVACLFLMMKRRLRKLGSGPLSLEMLQGTTSIAN